MVRSFGLLAAFGLLCSPALAQDEVSDAPNAQESASAPEAKTPKIAPPKAEKASAVPPTIPTENFAGRSLFWNAKLSPNGSRMSFLRRSKEGQGQFAILRLADMDFDRVIAMPKDYDIEWYRWVTDEKLLISVSTAGNFFGDEVRYTRLIYMNPNDGSFELLFKKYDAVRGDDVIHVAEDGSHILVAMQRTIYDYPSVMRHDLGGEGKIRVVQKPRDGVWNWVADNNGTVRMGTGWLRKRLRVFYRSDAQSKLKEIARIKREDDEDGYWDAVQIVSGSDQGYVLSEGENGRVGLRLFDFAKREDVETVYEHPDWDIDTVTLRKGEPFAAFYTADRDEVHWFDEKTAKQYAGLRKALGDLEIWVTSRSKDHSRMLVWAGSESDPGVLYLYDPDAKRLDQIAEYRPNLDFRMLAAPKPIEYKARDGVNIKGYLTLPMGREAKGLPLILMPHGGPYGVRDKLAYNDEVQLLANRGYAVLQPNFRGSGGYGDAFFELGAGQIGRGMQDDLDDAMDWAVTEGIADPSRVCVVGSSYGGYAAIWAVLRNPDRYRCGASWAGVTDWDKMIKYDRQFFGRQSFKRWRERVRGEGVESLDSVSPYRLAEGLKRPLLLAHGTEDSVVPIRQYRMFEKETREAVMPPTTLVIEGEGHSFSKPENEKAWYDALEEFLAEHNPTDPAN